MAWESSDRRQRLPPDWQARVNAVWARDSGICRWRLPSGKRCPRKGRDVDHVINNDDHSLPNLRLLCGHHHDKKTQWESLAGRRKGRGGKRQEERHPLDGG